MMNKKISALLTGVSLAALSIAARGTAVAASTYSGTTGNVTQTTNVDHVLIDTGADIDTFTNQANVGPGQTTGFYPKQAIAVEVTTTAVVDLFVNTTAASIFASATTSLFATATGIHVDGTVGLIDNNGTINASANASQAPGFWGSSAFALAFGVNDIETGGTSNAAALDNSGTINAVANASVLAFSAWAGADAVGVGQFVTGSSGTASVGVASVVNTGLIAASANATGAGSAAWVLASATGVAQIIDDAADGSAVVTNWLAEPSPPSPMRLGRRVASARR